MTHTTSIPTRRRAAPAALRSLAALAAILALGACDREPVAEPGTVAYTGATLWDGTGAPAVTDATLLVQDGRILSVEAGGAVPRGAEEVDLSGRWVTPGLVDAHAHVSGRWADSTVTDAEERVEADLLLFARYGVTTVNSLGGEPVEAEAVRGEQDFPAPGRARLHFAGDVVVGPSPMEAELQVIDNADRQVDWIKMRVDDNLGTAEKMPWPAVEAAITAAHGRGLRVATHLFYLADAERLLDLGTDLVAHSVRDTTVPESFALRLRQEGVCYVPTLTREVTTFVYAERPEWFDDPFFLRWASEREMAVVTEPDFQARMAASRAAWQYREALTQAQENLAILVEAGAPVAFGTDSGPAARFPGYLQHLELRLMVDAGLTPEQALRSATSEAAGCLGLSDVGILEAGRWADFLVFEGDPLADIDNTKTLEAVYVGGAEIPRN